MAAARPAGNPGPVSARLASLVSRHSIAADPLQQAAARELDRIADALARPGGFLPPWLGRPAPTRGAYLVGRVGRGKTMLMDLFFDSIEIAEKRREHFHEFMDEMHSGIAAFRNSPRGNADNADPIAAVAKPILEQTRLLCLDEFQVEDITDAMLLGRLFEKLFAGGLVLVATSNTEPDGLYRHGLNRELLLPFIALLKRQCEIVALDGPTDYRRQKFTGESVFQFGTGPAADAAMDRLWLKLTGGDPGRPETLRSLGRDIPVPRAAMGAARFDFAALCDAPLGARDYLKLAQRYETVVIGHVPIFERTNPSAAKRFILLVDTLYDRRIKLAASFAAPLDQLVRDDRQKPQFARALSRLSEMQSAEYLASGRLHSLPS